MACDDKKMDDFFLFNISDLATDDVNMSVEGDLFQFNTSTSRELPPWHDLYLTLSFVIGTITTPIVFFFGICGNVSNLVILGKKTFRRGLNHIEKSALYGLIMLSASDLMFCIVGFPGDFLSVVPGNSGFKLLVFIYRLYRVPLLNVFLFTSTWLIVIISMERYMAVCHPFQARLAIRTRRSVLAHCTVFFVSIILNIPLFMKYKIQSMPCPGTCSVCYYQEPTQLVQHYGVVLEVHTIAWGVVGTFLPLALLSFCNANILAVVCRADSLGTRENQSNTFSRVTITLVVMVFMYLTLVTPSMMLAFARHYVTTLNYNQMSHFRMAIEITNFCQAIKFSSNFMLYCVVNKQFRDSAANNMTCKTTVSSRTVTPECSNASNKRYQIVGPHS